MKRSVLIPILFILLTLGIADAGYLTWEHFSGYLPPCSVGIFADCGKVLGSPYATPFGIPLALLGLMHYIVAFIMTSIALFTQSRKIIRFLFLQTAVGILFSALLVYLQIAIIQALCQYCMASALISLLLYIVVRLVFTDEYQSITLKKIEMGYQYLLKPILFLVDPERIHTGMVHIGAFLGQYAAIKTFMKNLYGYEDPAIKQKVAGIPFRSPIGLAAGYDYYASLTGILPSLGFGFQAVGTITNMPCEGNNTPRLGRLPKSRSLLVNKGYRNHGAQKTISDLKGKQFEIPVAVSIGVSNSDLIISEKEAIEDIVSAFTKFQKSSLKHAYYELNISCPNLTVPVSFYKPHVLKKLLHAIIGIKLSKPLFVKLPIELSDKEFLTITEVLKPIKEVTGIIIGNLQKNRRDRAFDRKEIENAGKGNFSGKPTERRSNELIKLAYKTYKKRFIIIGCGGVFTAQDAYVKIRLGATLIQMITGMIFEGPQRIAQINRGLSDLLRKDGYRNLKEAVGVDVR